MKTDGTMQWMGKEMELPLCLAKHQIGVSTQGTVQKGFPKEIYRHFSNIRCTESKNIIVYRLVLQLALSNPLKPGVELRMKM